jgi:hypothetical protein
VEIVIAIVAGVLLAVVFVVISAPLRAARRPVAGDEQPGGAAGGRPALQEGYERAELEAARETKYREIRDAELDLRTGKLSREDYEAIDGGLRAEALEILDRLEALGDAADGGETADSGETADRGDTTASPAKDNKAKPEVEG